MSILSKVFGGEVDKEKAEKWAKICKMKEELKTLAAEQKEDKAFLRTDHRTHPKVKSKWSDYEYPITGDIQNRVRSRARKITMLHIEYNKARGKPYDMHIGD